MLDWIAENVNRFFGWLPEFIVERWYWLVIGGAVALYVIVLR